jgi:hypothetical protein
MALLFRMKNLKSAEEKSERGEFPGFLIPKMIQMSGLV